VAFERKEPAESVYGSRLDGGEHQGHAEHLSGSINGIALALDGKWRVLVRVQQ
jgi:hypothetical protein